MSEKKLLAIVELGGYPDFRPLYQRNGFSVTIVHNMRKAIACLKKEKPRVVVAEFNYQSDFRDRTSSLESLLATIERLQGSLSPMPEVIVFYDPEYQHQLQKLQNMFSNFIALTYPIQEQQLQQALLASN